MRKLTEINDKIRILKRARIILQEEYESTEFHKKKEADPESTVPSEPEDEEIYKLLTAIQQLDNYIKRYQDDQFEFIKEQEAE